MKKYKKIWLVSAGICLAILLFFASLSLGASQYRFPEVLRWMMGRMEDETVVGILRYVRLPRSIGSMLCGISLAVSGLLLQSALGNPLASANTIGVNSGAGLFAVLASVLVPGVFLARPIFAFAGALFAALLVYGISKKAGGAKSTIILTGVAVGSLLSAGTDLLVTLKPDSLMDKTTFFMGGFAHLTIQPILYALPFIFAGLIGAVFLSPRLNLLSLGDETAASLGLHVSLCRFFAMLCAALLAASAVSIGGLLGFVGLIVPHGARLLMGFDHRKLIPFSALLGGALVTGCDILARMAFAPFEIPVGILLSLLGAPFFLLLVIRRRKERVS